LKQSTSPQFVQLRADGVHVIVETLAEGLPRILHWGRDLGDLSDLDICTLYRTGGREQVTHLAGDGVAVGILPSPADDWLWTPGVTGHRSGADFSPAFTAAASEWAVIDDPVVAHRLTTTATAEDEGLALRLELELTRSGLLRMRAEVSNTGAGTFDLSSVDLTLPVPNVATELMDMTGRHLRERALQRRDLTIGTHLRESRRASGHEASVVTTVGTPGFGFRHGEVWAMHVGWSGNTRLFVERTNTGVTLLGGGELLLAGEVRLAQGESYRTPWIYGATGRGLDEMAGRFHQFLRSRPQHPSTPRPVTLNVWEAVYFNHDVDRLVALAKTAAAVGVERYVLDDGWFRHRRDDSAGLGDWYVDETVWPDGLGPLVTAVHTHGMQFGLWFEPEMISPDSDLARAHPEWIMAAGHRLPRPQRHQQVLNLTIPEAYTYIRDRISALVTEYDIDYIKWDHNRALVEAGDRTSRRPKVHEQTLAVYRLLGELKAAHPDLEIESCASGGGRIDLGIMAHADRVWASDCIDPLERQLIETGTSLLLPPELVGSHVASPVSHSTGRAHDLDLRAGTAFFSHMGIEWDLLSASAAERTQLARWVAAHKQHRDLLHHGTVVHADLVPDGLSVHGTVAEDAARAIYAVTCLRSPAVLPFGRVRLPGLAPWRRYRVRPLPPGDATDGNISYGSPAWWADGVELSGYVLSHLGVQMPALRPEHRVLVQAEAV